MDPSTMALVGAGIGAMMDEEKPLRGAALGGMGGYAGGAAMGAQAGTAGAYGSAMGATAPMGSIGGIGASTAAGSQHAMLAAQGMGTQGLLGTAAPAAMGSGSQAAMLAAQTGEFGTPGLVATGDALATPGTMAGHGFNLGNKLSFGGGDSANMIKAGQAISGSGEQEQRRPTIIGQAPQINPQAGGQFTSPYQREDERMFTYGQPSLLPSFRR